MLTEDRSAVPTRSVGDLVEALDVLGSALWRNRDFVLGVAECDGNDSDLVGSVALGDHGTECAHFSVDTPIVCDVLDVATEEQSIIFCFDCRTDLESRDVRAGAGSCPDRLHEEKSLASAELVPLHDFEPTHVVEGS